MKEVDFDRLMTYARAFSGYSSEREALLAEASKDIMPRLDEVTDRFYAALHEIQGARPFIEGRLEQLKATHHQWLEGLLTGPCDVKYTEAMYKVGAVHVKVNLPVEFMAGGTCLIQDSFITLVTDIYAAEPARVKSILEAINAALGFSLMVMQESYQASSLAEELEKFLAITGMSRPLFNNLAEAYKS